MTQIMGKIGEQTTTVKGGANARGMLWTAIRPRPLRPQVS